jgi:ligand-binding sensor domain-containing protein
MKCVKLLLLIFFFVAQLQAQEFAFQQFALKQGLPQSQVRAINQDSDGFLWVGTLGGLAKFDGARFDVFSVDDGLLSNRITFIDFFGDTMVVGHENGVSLSINSGNFQAIQQTDKSALGKFTCSIFFQGKIYIGSNGLGVFKIENNKLVSLGGRFSEPEQENYFKQIRRMILLGDKVVFGTKEGIFYTTDFSFFQNIEATETWSVTDFLISKDRCLISTLSSGIFSADFDSFFQGRFQIETDENAEFLYHSKQSSWGFVPVEQAVRKDLPDGIVSAVFRDRNKVLWYGTEGKGLYKFLGYAFRKIVDLDEIVMSITSDNKKLYCGTFNNGVFSININSGLAQKENSVPSERSWSSLYSSDKKIWFGVSNELFLKENEVWKKVNGKRDSPLSEADIAALHEDENGVIWIGTRRELFLFKGGKFIQVANKNNRFSSIRSIKSQKNRLFVATKTALFIINADDMQVQEVEFKNKNLSLTSLEFDFFGNLWIGSEEGIFLYANKEIRALDYSQQGASKFVNFIVRSDKKMFVGTNNGLFCFDVFDQELKDLSVMHYNESYGLTSPETNLNAAFLDKQKRLWFGTSEGLFLFSPKDINQHLVKYRPNLLLEDLWVNYGTRIADFRGNNSLVLKHHENRLRFLFRAVDLHKAENVKYQYFLVGLDEDWSPATEIREVAFNQLAPGQYILKVRAFNGNDSYSNRMEIPFEIKKPYFATWWFILIILILSGLLVFSALRFRVNQIRRQETQDRLELTNRLNQLEQQSLNASMNRHFIFNALNSIQFFINSQDKLSANKYLSKFAQLIRKNLDSSASGVNTVTLAEEVQRLELYLSLEAMRFDNSFTYSFIISDDIDAEDLLIPPMLFQPFIENAIIHGILPNANKVGCITFSAYMDGNIVVFKIADNGVGYSKSLTQKQTNGDHFSHGTSITKSRIEVIRQISGNHIEMLGPRDVVNDQGDVLGTEVFIRMGGENS